MSCLWWKSRMRKKVQSTGTVEKEGFESLGNAWVQKW